MEPQALITGRDAALILLLVEGIILSVVSLAAMWYVTRSLRRFLPRVAPGLRSISRIAATIREKTQVVCRKIVAPFVWISSAAQGVQKGLVSLVGRR